MLVAGFIKVVAKTLFVYSFVSGFLMRRFRSKFIDSKIVFPKRSSITWRADFTAGSSIQPKGTTR